MFAALRTWGHGTSFMIKSFLIQSRLATFHNSSWCGRTAGAGVRLFGSGGLPSAHIWGKRLTKPANKWSIGGGITPVPLGIKSMAPIRRQPARGRLNAPVSVSLGTVAMIPGQWLSRQAAGSMNQATSCRWTTELGWDNRRGWWWWELGGSLSAVRWK